MLQVLPTTDSDPHTPDSTCNCGVTVKFENGEMVLIHSAFKNTNQKWVTIEGEFKVKEGPDGNIVWQQI